MSFRLALGSDPEINLQSPTALKIRLQKDKEAALERRKKEGEAKLKAKQEKVAAARESRKRKKDLEEAKKQKARMAEEAREKEAAKDHPPTNKRPRQNSKGLFYSSLIMYIRPYSSSSILHIRLFQRPRPRARPRRRRRLQSQVHLVLVLVPKVS